MAIIYKTESLESQQAIALNLELKDRNFRASEYKFVNNVLVTRSRAIADVARTYGTVKEERK